MSCANCESRASRPHWGGYSYRCVRCCAFLVLSASPDKAMAAALLAGIALKGGRPERADILAEVARIKQARAERKEAADASGT